MNRSLTPLEAPSVKPIKHMADITLGKMLQPAQSGPEDLHMHYLRSANVQEDGALSLDDVSKMWVKPSELKSLCLKHGDVVVVEGGSVGRSAYLDAGMENVVFQNSINRLRPRGADGRFLSYSLQAARASGFFGVYCDTVSIAHLTAEKLGRVRLPAPPLAEQRAIANFLDHETAAIDALIEKQHELITRLRERLVALAHRAAFGHENLKDVKLGSLLHKLNRPFGEEAEIVTAFRDGQVTARSARRTEGFTESFTGTGFQGVEAGDLVFHALDGFAGAVGVAEMPGKCSPVYHVCEPTQLVDRDFAALLLRVLGDSGFLTAFAWSVRQRSVDYRNWPLFASLPVGVPPLATQVEAMRRFVPEKRRTVALIAKAEEFISLARERRSALITAAVTGRIDVTGQTGAGARKVA
jgi:type I restriction enzyme, S subunit